MHFSLYLKQKFMHANCADSDQTSHYAWVKTVCLDPLYGMLGTTGLREAACTYNQTKDLFVEMRNILFYESRGCYSYLGGIRFFPTI